MVGRADSGFDSKLIKADITAGGNSITKTTAEGTGSSRIPLLIIVILALASPASAYIGPGAGFGIVTSFLVFLNAIAASLLSALLWPVSLLIRMARRRRRELRQRARRVIVLGLDGLSPSMATTPSVRNMVAEFMIGPPGSNCTQAVARRFS